MCRRKVLVVDAVRIVIGNLFQIRRAVELNVRPANTVLSVGWDSGWWFPLNRIVHILDTTLIIRIKSF